MSPIVNFSSLFHYHYLPPHSSVRLMIWFWKLLTQLFNHSFYHNSITIITDYDNSFSTWAFWQSTFNVFIWSSASARNSSSTVTEARHPRPASSSQRVASTPFSSSETSTARLSRDTALNTKDCHYFMNGTTSQLHDSMLVMRDTNLGQHFITTLTPGQHLLDVTKFKMTTSHQKPLTRGQRLLMTLTAGLAVTKMTTSHQKPLTLASASSWHWPQASL